MRLGLGQSANIVFSDEDWPAILSLAMEQGLCAIVLDGIEKLPASARPPQEFLLEWIGIVMQDEARYAAQQKAAKQMADLFGKNYIRTYVLKGDIVAECYPKPEHRVSSDMDCFLLPMDGNFDAWGLGNDLVKSTGNEVGIGFYKNSTFHLPELTVENHRYMTPFRGNKRLKNLERLLQSLLKDDKGEDRFKSTGLYRPPVMMTALFLIEHAYSHFLHEGLTWRHVLDWMMFSRKHEKEIDCKQLEAWIDEFGFRKFYDSYYRLGQYLIGEFLDEPSGKAERRVESLGFRDKKMLADVWAPLDLHETLHGVKGKLGLVGNTLRAWWKYHYFAEISMPHALWIQAYGVLFDKNPTLDSKRFKLR